MVHRKRTFTEIDGQKLLVATETFGRVLFDALRNAPFGSEIFAALEALSGAEKPQDPQVLSSFSLLGTVVLFQKCVVARLIVRCRSFAIRRT